MFKSIVISSKRELTAREKIKYKDYSQGEKLDHLLLDEKSSVLIDVDNFIILRIENDKTEKKEYEIYVIVDKEDNIYYTSSESFYNAFESIYDELLDASEEDEFTIKVYKKPSKNYQGKFFITCSLF